jgi:hypothetical protein
MSQRQRRTATEQIEDAFCDLDFAGRERLLAALQALHRWRTRDGKTNGKPPEAKPEAKHSATEEPAHE